MMPKKKQRSGIRELHFTQKVITLRFKNKKREVVRFSGGSVRSRGSRWSSVSCHPSSCCLLHRTDWMSCGDPKFSTYHANSSLRSFGWIAGWACPHLKKPPTLERGNGGRLVFIFKRYLEWIFRSGVFCVRVLSLLSLAPHRARENKNKLKTHSSSHFISVKWTHRQTDRQTAAISTFQGIIIISLKIKTVSTSDWRVRGNQIRGRPRVRKLRRDSSQLAANQLPRQ